MFKGVMTLMMVVFVCSEDVCLSKWPTCDQCWTLQFAMQVDFQAWIEDVPNRHCGRMCRERSLIVDHWLCSLCS